MRWNHIWKLYLAYTVVLLVCMAAGGVALQAALQETLTRHIQAEVMTLSRVLARIVPEGRDPDSLDAFCREYQVTAGVRVTIIGRAGEVLGESDRAAAGLDNHGERPEVKKALEKGIGTAVRYSNTMEMDMVYAARLLPDGQRVLRVAMPAQKVEAVKDEVMVLVSLALYLAPLVAVGISFFFARRMSV